MNQKIKNNIYCFKSDKKQTNIQFISDTIIHITDDLSYKSFAVEPKTSHNAFVLKSNSYIEGVFFDIQINKNNTIDFIDKKKHFISQELLMNNKLKLQVKDNNLLKKEGYLNASSSEQCLKTIYRTLRDNDVIYGLGDKFSCLNKRGYQFTNWNTDDPTIHAESLESLYKSINLIIIHNKDITYGIFVDNTYKTIFNLGKENNSYFSYGPIDGPLNYYFLFGPSIKDVINQFTYLVGCQSIPQEWALGYHQSRWSYGNEKEVEYVAHQLRKLEIPCDAIHLDIAYMDNYKVFTQSKNDFPHFEKMIASLRKEGFKIVTIIDPGIKVEKGYATYEEGMQEGYFASLDKKTYVNQVWPGDSVFPNFNLETCRKWWANNVYELAKKGVSGIWNDMNEPASFNGPLPDDVEFNSVTEKHVHKEIHNVYGHLMAKATYEGLLKTNKRPFIITRAAYAGTQKYATTWTGDNQSLWSHLQGSIAQMCSLNLCGMPFVGTDVGGFNADCTKELMARWVQVGSMSPLFRNHSSCGSTRQEPWCFDKELENIYRKYVNLRYQLIPYFYDCFYKHSLDGRPILAPLVYYYPSDTNTFNINDEMMVGDTLLVAPVVQQGVTRRLVYLPEGIWVDFNTHKKYKGKKSYIIDACLDSMPLFVKMNSMLPTYPLKQYINNNTSLIMLCFGKHGHYEHYQDDGETLQYQDGKFNLYDLSFKGKKKSVCIKKEGFKKYESINFVKY